MPSCPEDHLPQPRSNASSNTAQSAQSPLCSKGMSVAHGQPDVHQNRQALPAKLLSCRLAPSLYWCLGLFRPRGRDHLRLSSWNFTRFLSAHFSSLSRCLWMAAGPSGVLATAPSLV